MNTKRMSISIVAGALLALTLVPGFAGAEPRFDPDLTSAGAAHYQIVKEGVTVAPIESVVLDYDMSKFLEENMLGIHSVTGERAANAVLDYDMSKFLEENMLGIHSVTGERAASAVLDYEAVRFLEENTLGLHVPSAQYAQVDAGDSIPAFGSPCQGEGLVGDAQVRNGITGTIESYCAGKMFAESLGTRTDGVPPAPQQPFNSNQGFTEY